MKKKYLFTIILGAFTVVLYSQNKVGVGTDKPQGTLHIDAKKDTDGANNISDDVVVTTSGNVGVGVLNPSNKLQVAGSMNVDGKEVVGEELTTPSLIVDQKMVIGTPSTLDLGIQSVENSPSKLQIFAPSPRTGLRLDDNTQRAPGVTYPVLQAQAQGKVAWVDLPTRGTSVYREVSVSTNVPIGGNNGKDVNIVSSSLDLDGGTWLIMAEAATMLSSTTPKTNGFAAYIKLYDITDMNTPVAVSASTSETTGLGVATPQLNYLLTVPKGTTQEFILRMSTSITDPNYKTTDVFGKPYFFAVKVNE